MNIGILSKRTHMLTGKLKQWLEDQGHKVSIFTASNLHINRILLENDFYILKSKSLFFLYAGYFLENNDIPVIPDTHTSFMQKNRIEAHYLLKKAGLIVPDIYLGTYDTFQSQLQSKNLPLILKPIMGSGSRGIKLINSIDDLNNEGDKILYLEHFIEGIHYTVYFIGDEICTLIKPPLSNEHIDMDKIETPNDIKKIIKKWLIYLNGKALFGHLDMVREYTSNKLYVIDPGSFPEFTNWKNPSSPVEKICNLILKQVRKFRNS
ncbi:MAG: RimK family alpha-L-glutamate ligase [Promethearchaeota archaeon]